MKILLATDGSESARAAVDCLLLFPFPRDSEVTVLTVIDRHVFKDEDLRDVNEEQRGALQETEKVVHDEARELLEREAERLRQAGWSASTPESMTATLTPFSFKLNAAVCPAVPEPTITTS